MPRESPRGCRKALQKPENGIRAGAAFRGSPRASDSAPDGSKTVLLETKLDGDLDGASVACFSSKALKIRIPDTSITRSLAYHHILCDRWNM